MKTYIVHQVHFGVQHRVNIFTSEQIVLGLSSVREPVVISGWEFMVVYIWAAERFQPIVLFILDRRHGEFSQSPSQNYRFSRKGQVKKTVHKPSEEIKNVGIIKVKHNLPVSLPLLLFSK
jgi:hypothetical protein